MYYLIYNTITGNISKTIFTTKDVSRFLGKNEAALRIEKPINISGRRIENERIVNDLDLSPKTRKREKKTKKRCRNAARKLGTKRQKGNLEEEDPLTREKTKLISRGEDL